MAGNEIARLWVTVDADTRPLKRGMADVERQAKSTTKVFSSFERKLALVGGAAAGLGIKKAADQVVGFDKAMRNVNSIAQLGEKRFGTLSKSVLSLSGKTAQAPITLAEGLYDLVSSGFDAKDSLNVLKSSAKAATAGLTDTATSTKAVAAVLNAYHLPAKQAAKVSDVLFKTVDRGVISFETLAQNVGDVLPFATALGVSLEEVGAATATMTKAGVSGPETMTRIKGAMVALIKPSKDMSAALKEIGVRSGEELIRKTGSLQGALQALARQTGGSKEAMAKLFPDIRGLGGALLLTGKNAKGAAADLKGMQEASGSTDKALSQQSKSLAFQWNKLKAEASSLAITVGSGLVPAFRKGLREVSGFVKEMRTGKGTGGEFANTMRNLGNALGDVLGVVKDVAGFLIRHPALLKAAAGAWVAYKVAALASLAATKLAMIGLFGPAAQAKQTAAAAAAGAATGKKFAARAAVLAAAGIAGWQLGKWLRDKYPEVKAAGDFLGKTLADALGLGNNKLENWIEDYDRARTEAQNPSPKPLKRTPSNKPAGRTKGGGPQGTGKLPGVKGYKGSVGATGITASASASGATVSGDTSGLRILSQLQAMARGEGRSIYVQSGYRSRAEQQRLWDNRHNNPYPVAPPGTSRHESGNAADITPGMEVFGAVAGKYGLSFPLGAADPVHVEGGGGGGGSSAPAASVGASVGAAAPAPAPRPVDWASKTAGALSSAKKQAGAQRKGQRQALKRWEGSLRQIVRDYRERGGLNKYSVKNGAIHLKGSAARGFKVDTTLENPWLQAAIGNADALVAAGKISPEQANALKTGYLKTAMPHLTGNQGLLAEGMIRDLAPGAPDSIADAGALLSKIDLQQRAGDLTPEQATGQKISTLQNALATWSLTDDARLGLRAELGDLLRENTEAQRDTTAALEAQNALLEEQHRDTQRALAVATSNDRTLGRLAASQIALSIGIRAGRGSKTPTRSIIY